MTEILKEITNIYNQEITHEMLVNYSHQLMKKHFLLAQLSCSYDNLFSFPYSNLVARFNFSSFSLSTPVNEKLYSSFNDTVQAEFMYRTLSRNLNLIEYLSSLAQAETNINPRFRDFTPHNLPVHFSSPIIQIINFLFHYSILSVPLLYPVFRGSVRVVSLIYNSVINQIPYYFSLYYCLIIFRWLLNLFLELLELFLLPLKAMQLLLVSCYNLFKRIMLNLIRTLYLWLTNLIKFIVLELAKSIGISDKSFKLAQIDNVIANLRSLAANYRRFLESVHGLRVHGNNPLMYSEDIYDEFGYEDPMDLAGETYNIFLVLNTQHMKLITALNRLTALRARQLEASSLPLEIETDLAEAVLLLTELSNRLNSIEANFEWILRQLRERSQNQNQDQN